MGILLTVNGIYNRSYQLKDLSTNRASTQISRLEYTADGGQGLSWTYYDYTYDSAGRIATYAPSVLAAHAEHYTYDELEQLTKVTKDYKTVASYTYDTAGNILTAQNATGTHTYCFKSMRDIITFSENGITQRHRAEVVAEIAWNDVMEIGIKWKQFAHSIPGWRLMPDRRCYIVYFSNHRLSREERACLG